MEASPEDTYKYIDPSPDGPRSKWDKAVKGLSVVEEIEKVGCHSNDVFRCIL